MMVPTYGAGRIIRIFLLLSHLPDEGENIQSACQPCGIQSYSTGARKSWLRCLRCWFSHCIALPFCMFEDGRSLDKGLSFLPFFRKGKKYLDYPVNPVSSKGICVYVESLALSCLVPG